MEVILFYIPSWSCIQQSVCYRIRRVLQGLDCLWRCFCIIFFEGGEESHQEKMSSIYNKWTQYIEANYSSFRLKGCIINGGIIKSGGILKKEGKTYLKRVVSFPKIIASYEDNGQQEEIIRPESPRNCC